MEPNHNKTQDSGHHQDENSKEKLQRAWEKQRRESQEKGIHQEYPLHDFSSLLEEFIQRGKDFLGVKPKPASTHKKSTDPQKEKNHGHE